VTNRNGIKYGRKTANINVTSSSAIPERPRCMVD